MEYKVVPSIYLPAKWVKQLEKRHPDKSIQDIVVEIIRFRSGVLSTPPVSNDAKAR